ncbi:hypothetical protein EON83_04070 [bacterium]|nr:MAG: hypothetical protein EON83_04070 [bacterium]
MNQTFSRFAALSLVLLPIALIARAQDSTPTPTPKPTKAPKPTKTPKPTRTPKATATPAPTPFSTAVPVPVSATDVENGRTLFVSRGGLIELRLASNPSTGYSWAVVASKNLELEGEPKYEATATAPEVVGSGGFTVFRFVAKKVGTSDLGLELRGPGDSATDAPSKTFRAVVKVLK